MGAAARKMTHATPPARPALRLVRTPRTSKRSRAALNASELFKVVVVCLLLLGVAGIARVSLAASAAEASIDSWTLRADVKAERLMSRALEADRSSLVAPSRIEQIASETLNMTRPTDVAYLQLPEATVVQDDPATEIQAEEVGDGLLATLVDLAAGEAQVMLVGDVGLGSLR